DLRRRGKVSFYSPGFSHLSRMAADVRLDLWSLANKVEQSGDVDCYLERTLVHPFNTAQGWLSPVEDLLFQNYAEQPRPQLVEWIERSDTVILESGLPLLFAERVTRLNPTAKMIYLASDDLRTIGCSNYLIDCLRRAAPSFNHAILPSRQLAASMPPGLPLFYVPHGFNHEFFQEHTTSPYADPVNAVSVGSMLFDDRFFKTACRAFPDVKFHIIGGGRRSLGVTEPNAIVLPEMAFQETVRYIVHASVGIAAYEDATTPCYLSDTSMKLAQYAYAGLNSVCPLFAAGGKPGRFGYESSDPSSIVAALRAALTIPRIRHEASEFLCWADVTDRILSPSQFPDTVM
ncbi:MAG: glycosyltransferase family 1 protein, partial [bacterium]